jgi:Concanavalin A-like lectin/glucanases superfamily
MQRPLWLLALVAGCGNVQAPPDAPPTIDLSRGCVLKALMDETSWAGSGRPVLDACGSNAGAITGTGATTTVDATRGRVGSFSNNACVEFASNATLHGGTGLTMSAWVRPTGLNGVDSNGVITKRIDKAMQSEYGLFVWTGDHVWIDLGNGPDRYEGTATLSNNVWSHLTAVFDSTRPTSDRVRLFINGVSDPLQHAMIGNLGATLPSFDSPLYLGCTPAPSAMPATQQTFKGMLDNVTIWNRALTDDEIAELPKT